MSDGAREHVMQHILLNRAAQPRDDSNLFERAIERLKVQDSTIFDKIDSNNDGVITMSELEMFLNKDDVDPPPTRQQLYMVALASAVPFIGFGFMDNAIMIMAGDLIEFQLGTLLSVSTMGAAAIGNLISDVAGVGLGSQVETLAKRAGIKEPRLTAEQLDMRSTKRASNFGASVGVSIGCFLGMFPLLLWPQKVSHQDDDDDDDEKKKKKG